MRQDAEVAAETDTIVLIHGLRLIPAGESRHDDPVERRFDLVNADGTVTALDRAVSDRVV